MLLLRRYFLILPLLLGFFWAIEPVRASERPQLGAQIWIEPGQADKQIDDWFHQLADAQMPVARLFMMWSYMEPRKGEWDFSLYDAAFRSAEKYHVAMELPVMPIRFAGPQKDCLMQVLENDGTYLLMVTNGSNEKRGCEVIHPNGFKSAALWGSESVGDGKTFELGPRGTSVVLYQPESSH
jgi:redox-sensitive bicupin YhaK (pirin superfamily)